MPRHVFDSGSNVWRGLDGASSVPAVDTFDRDSLVIGDYFPGLSTTGVLDPSVLVPSGGATFTSAHDGQTVENRKYVGYVNIAGPKNLTFQNCWFEPPASGRSDRPTVLGRNARNENVRFIDCTFFNPYKDPLVQAGYMGRGTTLRRCDISGSVDGVGAAPEGSSDRLDLVVEGTWIHDLLYVTPFSGQSDNQTHSDCIQWHGGPGLTIRGSRLEAFSSDISDWNVPPYPSSANRQYGNVYYPRRITTSALMVNSSSSFLPPGDMHVLRSWINGGVVGINMVGVPSAFLIADGSEIVGNRFGYDYGNADDVAIYCKPGHVFELASNYRWVAADPLDVSIPFNVRKFG